MCAPTRCSVAVDWHRPCRGDISFGDVLPRARLVLPSDDLERSLRCLTFLCLMHWQRSGQGLASSRSRRSCRSLPSRIAKPRFHCKSWQKAKAAGLLNVTIPKEYGGMSHGALESAIIAEELGASCAGISVTLLVNGLALTSIQIADSEERKTKFLLGESRRAPR